MNAQSVVLKCIDCKENFVLSGGEQSFFQSKSLEIPKRCPDCRHKRKADKVFQGHRIT